MANLEVSKVQNPSLLAVGARPDVLINRTQAGVFRAMDDPRRVVKVGTPGMPDSMLVVAVTITADMVGKTVGIACAAEFKTDTGRQSKPQKSWQAAFEKRGGQYAIIRSAAEMVAFVNKVKAGFLRFV